MKKVFVSDKLDEERFPFKPSRLDVFGQAHYSWKIISNLYCIGLKNMGINVEEIFRPEIYQTRLARDVAGILDDDIHLAVKPIEHLRPLYGATNFFVCGWEFPEFSLVPCNSNPLFNQIEILKSADKVLCWTDFTRNNLHNYGVTQAITLPPPVVVAEPETMASFFSMDAVNFNTGSPMTAEEYLCSIRNVGELLAESANKTVFVTILNPFDHRKQFVTMLKGFLQALNDNSNLFLLVKLVIDNKITKVVNINEILQEYFKEHVQSKNIVFIGDIMSTSQLTSFLKLGKYYLCTSSAEGLNLPLIESMLLGIPSVSTWNTAMSSYLGKECSICIDSNPTQMKTKGHVLAEFMEVTHFPPQEIAVTNAVLQAAHLDDNAYLSLSHQALLIAQNKFGLETFINRFNKAVNVI